MVSLATFCVFLPYSAGFFLDFLKTLTLSAIVVNVLPYFLEQTYCANFHSALFCLHQRHPHLTISIPCVQTHMSAKDTFYLGLPGLPIVKNWFNQLDWHRKCTKNSTVFKFSEGRHRSFKMFKPLRSSVLSCVWGGREAKPGSRTLWEGLAVFIFISSHFLILSSAQSRPWRNLSRVCHLLAFSTS